MARLVVKYKAKDPYYSDQTQTFIGCDINSCWDQMNDFEEWLGREHPSGIMAIYNSEIIKEEM